MGIRDGKGANKPATSLVGIACILAVLACNLASAGSTPAPTEPPAVVTTPLKSEDSSPPPAEPLASAPTATPEVEESVVLSAEGPWFVAATTEGMWILNSDGSGMTWIGQENVLLPRDFTSAAAPSGGHLALLTAAEANQPRGIILHVLSLPSGQFTTITALIAPQYEPAPDAMPGDAAFEALRAITELNSMTWSPDGAQLAFMGMVEGPTSDLYTYSLESGRISWLTDGPSQGIRPDWSPGGTYIAHQGVKSLGTGAGYNMAGVWAARADGAGVTRLYEVSQNSGDEKILGWLDDSTVLVYSWDAVCGTKNLRSVRIGGGTDPLWPGYFGDASLDPKSGALLFSVPDPMASCNGNGNQGLFLMNLGNDTSARVSDANVFQIAWSEAMGAFFAVADDGQVLQVDPTGQISPLPAAYFRAPEVDPVSKTWAIANAVSSRGETGVWVGESGTNPTKIFDQPAGDLTWSPQGGVLLFFGDLGLFAAQAPEYEPILRGPGMQLTADRGSAWVLP